MKRALLALALALPIVALAAGIITAESGARDATVWRIPVAGYDPRDPLRGHYVQFRYAWALKGSPQLCRRPSDCALCLEDDGTAVRVIPVGKQCPNRIDPARSGIGLRYAPEFEGTALASFTRLYVSEGSAPQLTKVLAAHPAVVVARLTRDGRLIPDRLEPAP